MATPTKKTTKITTKKTDDNLEKLLKENLALDEQLQENLPVGLKADSEKEFKSPVNESSSALTQAIESIDPVDSKVFEPKIENKTVDSLPPDEAVASEEFTDIKKIQETPVESPLALNEEVVSPEPSPVSSIGEELIKTIIPPEVLQQQAAAKNFPEEPAERPIEEVQAEAEQVKKEIAQEKADIESQTQEVGTLATAAHLQKVQMTKNPKIVQVEGVMQDGLKEYFVKMTPKEQEDFKIEGEKTASKIVELLRATKVKVVKILKLISNWLRMIPGVNKYF